MKRSLFGLILLAVMPAHAQSTPASAADVAFKALYSEEWNWRQQQFGDSEDNVGSAVNAHIPSVSPQAQTARLAKWQDVLAQLRALDPAKLGRDNQTNYAVYRFQVESLAADVRLRSYEMPFNSDSAFWSDLAYRAERPLQTADEARRYIVFLNDIPAYFDEQIANMRAGLRRGFSVPRATLAGRDESIATVAATADPSASLFYAPLKDLPRALAPEQQARLRAEALEAIRTRVVPAHARLLRFMREEYLAQARSTLAAEALPDGAAYYRAQIRAYTTLEMTPDAIHQLGLAEVAKIRAAMQVVMRETGFKGDFAAFLTFLRSDPQFYPKTAQELLARAAWICKRVDGKLGRYFGLLPRNRFTIEPVPEAIAPYYTAGRGGPDTYLVNTYALASRPLYNLTALTLHEAMPGHALQTALAREQGEQAPFRAVYISAFGEGWALYAEKLGLEMGVYDTPYDRFGMLTYQMWRAARLVVDTGIHTKGWTREQAIAFMRDNSALSLHEIGTEVDRYITWPGQALSYYIGAMTIERARARAELALGSRFDLRAFHDALLALGSVPLPLVEQRIARFIDEQGALPLK